MTKKEEKRKLKMLFKHDGKLTIQEAALAVKLFKNDGLVALEDLGLVVLKRQDNWKDSSDNGGHLSPFDMVIGATWKRTGKPVNW